MSWRSSRSKGFVVGRLQGVILLVYVYEAVFQDIPRVCGWSCVFLPFSTTPFETSGATLLGPFYSEVLAPSVIIPTKRRAVSFGSPKYVPISDAVFTLPGASYTTG